MPHPTSGLGDKEAGHVELPRLLLAMASEEELGWEGRSVPSRLRAERCLLTAVMLARH